MFSWKRPAIIASLTIGLLMLILVQIDSGSETAGHVLAGSSPIHLAAPEQLSGPSNPELNLHEPI